MRFRTILADPPWYFRTKTDDGRVKCPDLHYHCMKIEDIMALPVQQIADENCALLMWTTWAHLREAMDVIEAWGFVYKTGFPWVKMSRAAAPRRGIGFHVAQCSEPLLIATRGYGVSPPQTAAREIGIMFHPSGAHSAKPDDQYSVAMRYPAPRLEMFHRPGFMGNCSGWTVIGNEVTGNDIRVDLEYLASLPQPDRSIKETPATPVRATVRQESLFGED